MKRIGVVLGLLVFFGTKVLAQDFIIGAALDPYSAHGSVPSTAIIQEYFDSIKAFGVNRVIGIGDSVTTGQGIANSFGRFMVIPYNPYGGLAKEIAVTSQEPKTLERFTTYGWHMTLEVEKQITENDLKGFGCGFYQQAGIIPQGDTLRFAQAGTHSAGYLFSGPGGISDLKHSGLIFSPKFMVPGTWGQADYVLRLGTDTAGVPDTAVVARLVVYNANHYRIRYIDHGHFPAAVRDTSVCITDALHRPDTIFLCQQTTKPTGRSCGPANYQLKYDDPVLFNDSTNPITVAEAFVRDLRKADFCQAGQWETLSVHFYQTLDNPFNYSLFWTNRATLTADRVIISNDTGRVFLSLNPESVKDVLQSYYADSLRDAIPRQYLTDEPYSGSYPVVQRGKNLVSWPTITSPRKPTSLIAGYTGPPVGSYQWDILSSIVNPSEFNLEVYPIGCKMLPDSTISESDSCSIQLGFSASTPYLAYLSSRAKALSKPFWPWVQLFGIWSGLENGQYKQFARMPTYTEVKAQVNLALAYGAKGILYFWYSTTGEPAHSASQSPLQAMPSPMDLDGGTGGTGCPSCSTRTEAQGRPYRISGVMHWNGSKYVQIQPLWDSVRSVNVNILKKLGPTFMTLTWDTAGPGSNASGSTRGFLNSVTSDKFSTGSMFVEAAHFTGGGADYFMLVNRRCKPHENQIVTSWLNKADGSMWYVIDVLTGDTVLTGGTTGGAPFTTLLGPGEGKLFKVAPAPQYINGSAFPRTWQGKITLDGDVEIPFPRVLKILSPKAAIRFLANRDTLHTGVSPSKAEIIVNGTLLVTGTLTDSVKFISDAASPGNQDWYGVRVVASGGGETVAITGSAKFQYCQFKNAYAALSYLNTAEEDSVKNCLFQNNALYGIYTKNGYLTILNNSFQDLDGYGIYLDQANSVVTGNTIRHAEYGINAYKSFPTLSNDTIIGLSNDEFGLRTEGFVSGATQFATFSNCVDSGEFNQAAVVANARLKVIGSRIIIKAPDWAPIPTPQDMAILGLGGDSAIVRGSTVKYSGYATTTALIKATTAPLLDLGRSTDAGNNSVIKGGKLYAVQNTGSGTLPAIYNYWGGTPSPGIFSGLVAYTPYLTYPPEPKLAAGDQEKPPPLPSQFSLSQNFPNPFNPTTIIRFALPTAEKVRLDVYNIQGHKVKTLLDGEKAAGVHQVIWDGRDKNGILVSSGVYFYKVETATFREVKRMVFLK